MQKSKLGKSNLEVSAMGDRFEASHWSHHANSLQRWIRRSNGVDTCFMHQHQSHAPEDVASMERALASFHAAVAEEYGPEEAAKAAQDWIEELQKSCADWRSVTIAAARRLARRVVTPAQA